MFSDDRIRAEISNLELQPDCVSEEKGERGEAARRH